MSQNARFPRLYAYRCDLREDVGMVVDKARSRLWKGDPVLTNPSEDAGVNPLEAVQQHQARIQRRRDLFGLPYQTYRPSKAPMPEPIFSASPS